MLDIEALLRVPLVFPLKIELLRLGDSTGGSDGFRRGRLRDIRFSSAASKITASRILPASKACSSLENCFLLIVSGNVS